MAEILRRYTNIPALIYLLRERKITLLDPDSWDDRNDSYYLSLYRQKKSLKSILALCFTQVSETYHHWHVFAEGSSGVCIQFRHAALVRAIKKHPGVTAKSVRYLTLNEIRRKKLTTNQLPFLKRYPYEDEREFRAIYESSVGKKKKFLDIPVPLSCIDRITLSPWIPIALKNHLRRTIQEIDGCGSLPVFRSTLISNEEWKSLGEDAK